MNPLRSAAVAVVAGLTLSANAQTIDSFTISDGDVSYSTRGLTIAGGGSRTGTSSGSADFFAQPGDVLGQNWWWYRSGGHDREFALTNQVFGSASGSHALLVYEEPQGADLNSPRFRIQLEFTITKISSSVSFVQTSFAVTNLGVNDAPGFQLFNYTDPDILSQNDGDYVKIDGAENQEMIFEDRGVRYHISSSMSGRTGFELGYVPTLVNKLGDSSLTTLTNGPGSLPGGNHAGAFQWSANLLSGETLVGSTVQLVPEPASMAALGLGSLALFKRRRRSR